MSSRKPEKFSYETPGGREALSLAEVAARFGVHPRTIKRECERGELPRMFRLGSKLMMDAGELAAAIARKKQAGAG